MPTVERHVQDVLGEDARKLAQLTNDVLFGDVWERSELSKRDRSLVTVAALVAMYRLEQLPFHFTRALENGIAKEELVEIITHLAFYSGWPTAASAMQQLQASTRQVARGDLDAQI